MEGVSERVVYDKERDVVEHCRAKLTNRFEVIFQIVFVLLHLVVI